MKICVIHGQTYFVQLSISFFKLIFSVFLLAIRL